MDWGLFSGAVGVIGVLSGILLGWNGRSRTVRNQTVAEASRDATFRTDVEYIKRGVEDIKLEQRIQGQRFDQLSERVTRVEESAKQAHKRIERIEGYKSRED